MKSIKKIITAIIAVSIIMTMSVAVYAEENPDPGNGSIVEDTGADDSTITDDSDIEVITPTPVKPEPEKLTASKVRAIKPKASASSYSYTKIKVSWNKIEGIDGYKIYRATSKSGKYKLIKTITKPTTTSFINSYRTFNKPYYYKLRGYNKINGKTVYTKYSEVRSAKALPAKPEVKVTLPKDEQVKVSWNKVAGALGYQVYRKRVDKSSWKLFKSVSSKTTYTKDNLLGTAHYPFGKYGPKIYGYEDLDYIWEYKVRAYKVVNGKRVYGYFSKPVKFTPQWTINEVSTAVWKYIESLNWPLYEAVSTYPEPDKYGKYMYPAKDGSTYHLQHMIGTYTLENGECYGVYTNPKHGDTSAPKGSVYTPITEKNSSWTPIWPYEINVYQTKATVIKTLKNRFKSSLTTGVTLEPKCWDPEYECWSGTMEFTFYYKKSGNWYKVWCLE